MIDLRSRLRSLAGTLTRDAVVTGAQGISGRLGAQLGIGAVALAFLAGLTLGGFPSGYVGYLVGRASSDLMAERNRLGRNLAEARIDRDNAIEAALSFKEAGERNAAAKAEAERRNDEYAEELRRRGPLGACGFTDGDVARMRANPWALKPRARRAAPPARR